ncbi:hypothetical protein SAMN02910276_03008, partial [Butyrivibrio sp. Su6]|uniref:hypothetical protein n=1 Tax=Butyrivibrio sp. Su6 TaxID=1520810 RepID=UPI00089F1690
MEGMNTQDMLGGQDLSTANVDDLIAAMKAEEGAAVQEQAAEAPTPKKPRKKVEKEPVQDIPDLEAMLAANEQEVTAEAPVEVPAAEVPVEMPVAETAEMPAEMPAAEEA